MQRGNCYLFVFDGYSDWEPALAVYGLSRFTDLQVITFSIDGQPVTSGGNVRIQPDKGLADIDPADIALLLLPGGDAMESGGNSEIVPLVRNVARELYRQAITADLELAGALQWHYHDFNGDPDSDFTLEIGVPVIGPKPVPEPYACKTLPAFRCVSVQHSGSWSTLSETYEKLFAGIWMAGLKTSGHNREQYIQYDFNREAVNHTLIQVGLS